MESITVDIDVSLHRGEGPAFVMTVRGTRRPATSAEILRLQLAAALAPLRATLEMEMQAFVLWLRRVPRATVHIDVTQLSKRSVAS